MPKTERRPIIIGERIGRLLVTELVGTGKGGKRYLCKCDCGNTKIVVGANLRNKTTKSCGCLFKETQLKTITKHNKRYTRIYEVWKSMKKRCFNPNCKNYEDYGGRGIIVCDEWKNDFQTFYDWSMANGYADDLTIDRQDVNGNYEPSNCRWVTRIVQANNKRNNLLFVYNGETHTVAEWSRLLNIRPSTIYSRIRRGYGSKKILEEVKK